MSAFILGSTGLVGLQILKYADKSTVYEKITTVSRRIPSVASSKINSIEEADSEKWFDIIEKEAKDAKTFYSAFGTTRANAGSAENFRKIDYGINYEAAKAAKRAGVETFVLISTVGANAKSWLLYLQVKGQLENDIIDLKFPRTIILRPGPLLGAREKPKGLLNDIMVGVMKYTHGNFLSFISNPIYGEEVAQIAVILASEGFTKGPEPLVKIVEASELTKLYGQL
ncbi:protein FMP52-1, mitochondrial [Scheffersomyces xylosifermentans]|uniref:protein FMP52-1, mitochondrial n=1 Tax=Scheffersomyces xylosifermentans TaxID=1304137 RepID=UPI00315D345F